MGKRSRSGAGPAGKQQDSSFDQFVNSYTQVCNWFRKGAPLRQQLEKGGGLIRIENFLPNYVADGILGVLEGVGPDKWSQTAAAQDYKQNNISHKFWSTKQAPGKLCSILRMFSSGLFPEEFSTFSAARYEGGHHIAPHDDRAHAEVKLDDGSIQLCSRDVAVIYYLTKNWTVEMGGALIDLEDPKGHHTYVPMFNSAVVFLVPRFHQVTPVTTTRPRFSIFGWSLHPGQLYELMTTDSALAGDSALADDSASAGVGGSSSKKEKTPLKPTISPPEPEFEQSGPTHKAHSSPLPDHHSKKVEGHKPHQERSTGKALCVRRACPKFGSRRKHRPAPRYSVGLC